MKAWLVTWEWVGNHAAVEEPVVAILSARKNARGVRIYVEQRYIEETASFEEKLSYARYNRPRRPPHPAELTHNRIHCGHNPFLYARVVDDLSTEINQEGNEELTWTEPGPPRVRNV
jgi:hypothetical protein